MGLDVWAYNSRNEPMDERRFFGIIPVLVGGERIKVTDPRYPCGVFNHNNFRGREYSRVMTDLLGEEFTLYQDMDNQKVSDYCGSMSQLLSHNLWEDEWKHEIVSYTELLALYQWMRTVAVNDGNIRASY